MGYLTTIYLVKTFSEIDDNSRVERIIPYAHKAIEEYLDYSLELATYRKWLNGNGSDKMLLKEWPVRRFYGCSISAQDAMTITFAGGEWATVETTKTGINLFSVSTDGAETDTEILYSAYKTVGEVAAQINTKTGWTATVLADLDDHPSAIIRSNCTANAVSPDDMDIEVPDEPVDVNLLQDMDRTVQRKGGFVFPEGRSNVFVWYKSGYTMPVDRNDHQGLDTEGNVPGDLTLVANLMVKAIYDAAEEDLGPASEIKSGDWTRKFNEGARGIADLVLAENAQVLAPYKNFV